MRHLYSAIATLGALVLTATSVHGAAVFSSQPHILAFGDRQQVILFAQDGIDGAIATRRADGSWDIVIPNAAVGEALAGQSFIGPPTGAAGEATQVDLESIGNDVRLRVRPAGDVARVVAYGVSRPPRLMVDLLSSDAAKAERPEPTKKAERPEKKKAEKPEPRKKAAAEPKQQAKKPEPKAETRTAKKIEKKPAEETAKAARDLAKSPAKEPTEKPKAEVVAEPSTPPTEPNATQIADTVPATRKPELLASAEPAPVQLEPREEEKARREEERPAPSAPAVALIEPPADVIDVTTTDLDTSNGSGRVALALEHTVDHREQHCLYTRVAGVPFCAPNGEMLGYAEDPHSSGIARRIAAGATWLPKIRAQSSARPYLEADREFLRQAKKGWLLATIPAYKRALRLGPDFPDALRAHMNIALIYAQLGFQPELEMHASNTANPARAFASAILGDQRLEDGFYREAADLYEYAAEQGGMPACIAARGLAHLALEEGRVQRADEGISMLRDLCPRGFVDDPDTERLRARIALSLGDANGALATLDQVEARLKRPQRGEIVHERALIAEGAGRLDEARKAWAELETGAYGPKLEAQAAIALARLEGTHEAVDDGLSRLEDLPPEDRAKARNELLVDVSGDALAKGDDLSAVAMILSEGMDPSALPPREQVELAAAYRRLGLDAQARETLDRVERHHGGGLPERYFQERGALALDAGDLGAAEDILRRWQRSRGGNPSAGELELRVRVLAGRNVGATPIEGALRRLAGLERSRATKARWQAAASLADRDPAMAVALLSEAGQLEKLPKLPDEDLAETLWALGRASEAHGETQAALAAYRALGLGLPETARGADASYRAARLLEIEQQFPEAERAFQRAAGHPKAIDRRLAEASSAYHGVVRPWPRKQENL